MFILFLLFGNIIACSQDEEGSRLPFSVADKKQA